MICTRCLKDKPMPDNWIMQLAKAGCNRLICPACLDKVNSEPRHRPAIEILAQVCEEKGWTPKEFGQRIARATADYVNRR